MSLYSITITSPDLVTTFKTQREASSQQEAEDALQLQLGFPLLAMMFPEGFSISSILKVLTG